MVRGRIGIRGVGCGSIKAGNRSGGPPIILRIRPASSVPVMAGVYAADAIEFQRGTCGAKDGQRRKSVPGALGSDRLHAGGNDGRSRVTVPGQDVSKHRRESRCWTRGKTKD